MNSLAGATSVLNLFEKREAMSPVSGDATLFQDTSSTLSRHDTCGVFISLASTVDAEIQVGIQAASGKWHASGQRSTVNLVSSVLHSPCGCTSTTSINSGGSLSETYE